VKHFASPGVHLDGRDLYYDTYDISLRGLFFRSQACAAIDSDDVIEVLVCLIDRCYGTSTHFGVSFDR